jgi:hypothetical protein
VQSFIQRFSGPAVKDRARHWERAYGVRVTVEPPLVTVRFPDGETLRLRFRRSPLVNGVQWLTEDRQALDKVPGLLVRERALARNGRRSGPTP